MHLCSPNTMAPETSFLPTLITLANKRNRKGMPFLLNIKSHLLHNRHGKSMLNKFCFPIFRKMHKNISVAAPFLATYAAYVSQEFHDHSCSTLTLDHA